MRHPKALLIPALLALAFLPGTSPATPRPLAGQRPAAHWGTFTKNASLRNCLSISSDALRSRGYRIDEGHGYIRIGEHPEVIVQVACIPLDAGRTSVTVSAYSTDSATAELARNEVRAFIARTVPID